MRALFVRIITLGLWGEIGKILMQFQQSIQKVTGILDLHESVITELKDDLENTTYRLNELMRHLEQYTDVVIPSHIDGPRLTTLGEFGIGDGMSPMTEEERGAIERALEQEREEAEARMKEDSNAGSQAEA